MKTKELIAELQRLDPTGELPVEVAVRTSTRAYPAAYVEPIAVACVGEMMRVTCSLPEGMHTVKRAA